MTTRILFTSDFSFLAAESYFSTWWNENNTNKNPCFCFL